MHASLSSPLQFLLAATTLLTTAVALSIPQPKLTTRTISTSPGPWCVTNYDPGCGTSPAGCAYSFSIAYTSPTNPSPPSSLGEPSFSTSCNGTDVDQVGYKPCADDSSVASKTEPGTGNFTLFVQHSWTEQGVSYVETGNVTITELETSGQSFEIVPSQITAVA